MPRVWKSAVFPTSGIFGARALISAKGSVKSIVYRRDATLIWFVRCKKVVTGNDVARRDSMDKVVAVD